MSVCLELALSGLLGSSLLRQRLTLNRHLPQGRGHCVLLRTERPMGRMLTNDSKPCGRQFREMRAMSRGFSGQSSATVTRKKVAGMEVAFSLGLLF